MCSMLIVFIPVQRMGHSAERLRKWFSCVDLVSLDLVSHHFRS
jgi:hypothetical protein